MNARSKRLCPRHLERKQATLVTGGSLTRRTFMAGAASATVATYASTRLAAGTGGAGAGEPAASGEGKTISARPTVKLEELSLYHGGVKATVHPRLKRRISGLTAIRTMRFMRKVSIDRLELGRISIGRWQPTVPCHPAHVIVSVLDPQEHAWQTVKDIEIPPDPRISGAGLSQKMSIAEMDEYLRPALGGPPFVIDLNGLETDHLRIECDREHPVWPSHGECYGSPYSVPFGILNNTRVYGKMLEEQPRKWPYNGLLRQGRIAPQAPVGMRVEQLPHMLRFESDHFSIGFSLKRPVIMHLGWDSLGEGWAHANRCGKLNARRNKGNPWYGVAHISGPVFCSSDMDCCHTAWTGDVEVRGDTVIYRNVRAFEGLSIDAEFKVHKRGMRLKLIQHAAKDLPAIEAETWRFSFDLKHGITGVAGMPTLNDGRNGEVMLPAMFASDGVGCLSCRNVGDGMDTARLQVESYRSIQRLTAGVVMARRIAGGGEVVPKGTRVAALDFEVTNILPETDRNEAELHKGIKRAWSVPFAGFRPEFNGFSIQSASTGCTCSIGIVADNLSLTRKPMPGLDHMALARMTAERGLLDGGGYCYWRNLYSSSDPLLVSGVGRLHQVSPDMKWLRNVEPGLTEAVERMLGSVGSEGLLVCKDLSGNSGSFRWGVNTLDVVSSGHIDGETNAWGYRALRNAYAMFQAMGNTSLAVRCNDAARSIKENFARVLLNPDTGWVGGWRSRDGELHDYGFTWINGPAIAFGLLEPEQARTALRNLQSAIRGKGITDAYMGLPLNIVPFDKKVMYNDEFALQVWPGFEVYCDGALSGFSVAYLLRALSLYGFQDEARKMATEMAEGLAMGYFSAGMGDGVEWSTWDGVPTGYEGTQVMCFMPLYAIAIELGYCTPAKPEWWPVNG